MSGVADVRSEPGLWPANRCRGLTAHATFSGSSVDVDQIDLNFNAGASGRQSGKVDIRRKAFRPDCQRRSNPACSACGIDRQSSPTCRSCGDRDQSRILEGVRRGRRHDFSPYQIEFDAESNNATSMVSRRSGELVGRTENKQLNVTLTSTGLLGQQPQLIAARVDLSKEKLPATIESTINDADMTQLLKILVPGY